LNTDIEQKTTAHRWLSPPEIPVSYIRQSKISMFPPLTSRTFSATLVAVPKEFPAGEF
jgi:hypothetical protein